MKKIILIFISLTLALPVLAQTSRNPCFINETGGCTSVSTVSPLPVLSGNVSELNSTSTALSGSATYTGTWENVSSHNSVVVAVLTDKDGTLYVDFSPDGVNQDSSLSFVVTASVNEVHRLTITRKYYRIRYVNGSSAQTYMRLQSAYGDKTLLSSPLNSATTQDADAIVSKTVDPFLSIQQGLFTGYAIDSKFGRNSAVTTAEDIWNGGGYYTGQPVNYTPEIVTVVSSSNLDTNISGSGAWTLRIIGLKTSTSTTYESEDINLNGLTPVDSVNSWWRLNRAYVLTGGSGGANAGSITIAAKVTTTNVFAVMPIGYNQTAIAAYTVPYGYTAYIKRIDMYGSRANSSAYSDMTLRIRPVGGVFNTRRIYQVGTGIGVDINYVGGQIASSGSDIKIRAENVSAGSLDIAAEFAYILIKD